MSTQQSLYFMSLAGALAGLISWVLTKILAGLGFLQIPQAIDFVAAALLGGVIAAMAIGFTDKWLGNRLIGRWVITGSLIGLLAGICAELILIPARTALIQDYPRVVRILDWVLVGSFIGLAVGLRWMNINKNRIVHGFTGGLAGGLVGGLLFSFAGGSYPDFIEAWAFILMGTGICAGVALAPTMLRQGTLQFVSSGDAAAQSKLGRPPRKQWELQDGNSYVIGAQESLAISIPDTTVAPRHAMLFAKGGRFYLERHPEIRGKGQSVLRVKGKTVSSGSELHHNDDVTVGRTVLRFITRDKPRTL